MNRPDRTAASLEGYHRFQDTPTSEPYGSFQVFWNDGGPTEDEETVEPGWYWWSCFPGCMPDGPPMGPFPRSTAAYMDANPELAA